MKLIEQTHTHKFLKPKSKTVMLYKGKSGGVTGKDVIKQMVCSCGETRAIDLERIKT